VLDESAIADGTDETERFPFRGGQVVEPEDFYRGDMKVGAVYMVRGGHILRYRGLYTRPERLGPTGRPADNPCLAFGPVQDEGPFDPPVGASIVRKDVLYEVTPSDLGWLRDRREQRLARKLDTADIEHLIRELTLAERRGEPS
jgi:hypothetical protein